MLCSLRRARHLIGLSLQLGCCHSDKTALPASDHDAENGAEAEAKQPQARGQAELLILSLATVTTVVGAAVLSKHDGAPACPAAVRHSRLSTMWGDCFLRHGHQRLVRLSVGVAAAVQLYRSFLTDGLGEKNEVLY